jgi:hypothetical protein
MISRKLYDTFGHATRGGVPHAAENGEDAVSGGYRRMTGSAKFACSHMAKIG